MITIQQINQFREQAKKMGKTDAEIDSFINQKLNSQPQTAFSPRPQGTPTPTPTPNAPQEPQKEGFFKSAIKGLASPFLKLGATADALSTSKYLGGSGTNNSAKNTPVGQVKPITTAREAAGVGLELGAFAVPVGGTIASQVVKGALMGALSSGGGALQEDSSLGDKFKQTAIGAATGGVAGGVFGVIGKLGEAGLGKLQTALEKKNLKLTPAQATKLGTKLEEITDLGTRMPQYTPKARAGFAADLVDEMETHLQDTLQRAAGVQLQLPKQEVISRLKAIPNAFNSQPATKTQATSMINRIVKTIEGGPDYIPLSALNDAKRDFAKGTYDVGGRVKDEISDAIAGMYRESVEQGAGKLGLKIPVPPSVKQLYPELPEELTVREFNKIFGTILSYRRAIEAAANKSDVGFLNRLLSEVAGGSIGLATGGPAGAIGGSIAGKVVSENAPISAARSLVGRQAVKAPQRLLKTSIIGASKGATQRQPQQQSAKK